jgi:hypothetical protein
MATSDEAVCESVLACSNFSRSVLSLLKSLQPELVHRSLIVTLNILNMENEESKRSGIVALCEASLLPVLSVVIDELKGESLNLFLEGVFENEIAGEFESAFPQCSTLSPM